MHYILALLYLSLSNWLQMKFLIFNQLKRRGYRKITKFNDVGIPERVKNITHLDLQIFIIDEPNTYIGFMHTFPPFKPVMSFSSKLISEFNKNELEWVILHEAGHYIMWHNLKTIIFNLLFLSVVLLIVNYADLSVLHGGLICFVMAIIEIQFRKIFEYQADRYSAKHITDPEGMITGNLKMMKAGPVLGKYGLLKKLFVIAVPHEKRIEMAKRELRERSRV